MKVLEPESPVEGGARAARAKLRVALVNMPFSSARFPSLQLGLLLGILQRNGISAAAYYFNLEYASRIGWKQYEILSDNTHLFLGDWMFARAAFGKDAPDGSLFLDRYCRRLSKVGQDFLRRTHDRDAKQFIDDCVASAPWHLFDVVGFSSVFVQNCAALALARALKEKYPRLITVFGGANFEDEMGLEYVRTCPWIDYAVLGEGDETFPALLDCIASGEPFECPLGVARRVGDEVEFRGHARLVRDLDSLPIPNFDAFFDTAARLRLPAALEPDKVQLPYESARGCWWGEKHHCTFCGLNALGMSYRSKSVPRVLDEIEQLTTRYRSRYLGAVDNILDHRHVDGVFGNLAQAQKGYQFFYEIKANLRRDQIEKLAAGGMRRVQPGIESLNTHVLQLMKKGVTAAKNVRLLKWARFYKIAVSWNLLVGFPGEAPEDYETQLAVIKNIPHLHPPAGVYRISLERFSPNFNQAAEMGFHNIRPLEAYSYVYPQFVDNRRIAYFFEYDAPATLPDAAFEPIRSEVARWQRRWRAQPRSALTYSSADDELVVHDDREGAGDRQYVFGGKVARVLEFCGDTDQSLADIVAHVRRDEPRATVAAVRTACEELKGAGLMFEDNGHFLSLCLPVRPEQ